MSEVNYFGFGAMRSRELLSAITGRHRDALVGNVALLKGYGLTTQTIDHVPDYRREGSFLPAAPRRILLPQWGPHFRSHAIAPRPNGMVMGVVWELTHDEIDRVDDWELAPEWHRKRSCTVVVGNDEIDAITYVLGEGQMHEEFTDGISYETFLRPQDDYLRIASVAKAGYDARTGQ